MFAKVQALATPAAILAVAEKSCLDAEQSIHAAVEAVDLVFLTKSKIDSRESVAVADAEQRQSHVAVLLQLLNRAVAMLLHLLVADSVCLTK